MTNLLDIKIRHQKDGTPILRKDEIERHACDYLAQYGRDTKMYDLYTPMATPIEEIIEEYCKIKLSYMDFWDKDVLGVTVFTDGVIKTRQDNMCLQYATHAGEIIISSRLSDDDTKEGRYRYSLGHELAHVFYHREKYENNFDSSPTFDFGEVSNNTKKTIIACREEDIEMAAGTCANNWEEWLSDYFSACILMPSVSVNAFIEPYLNKREFALSSEVDYPLSHLPMNEQVSIVDNFMKIYGVSRQVARVRLKALELMKY